MNKITVMAQCEAIVRMKKRARGVSAKPIYEWQEACERKDQEISMLTSNVQILATKYSQLEQEYVLKCKAYNSAINMLNTEIK